MKTVITVCAIMLSILVAPVWADEAQSELLKVQKAWAKANYGLPDKQKISALEALIGNTDVLLEKDPKNAELWIWNGIVNSTLAGAKGGLGALGYVKKAKISLETALEINPEALSGSAYTSLATLYHKVPGWPVAFGSDKKAASYFAKALALNPDGIDPNYFYAEYLSDNGEYAKAKTYLEHALEASPRVDRELADKGRRAEVEALLAKVIEKL